jgi:hypothetical protein
MEKKFFDVRSEFCCKLDCIEFRYKMMLVIDSKAVLKVQIMSPHTTSNSRSSQNTTVTKRWHHSVNPGIISWPFSQFLFSVTNVIYPTLKVCRSQWPRGLGHRCAVARLMRSWVLIPQRAWLSFCLWVLCVIRGFCDELITRPEESYRMRCIVVCDLETSWMRRPWPTGGSVAPKTNT